jgi:pimeloyl-ACP methyl ester carboxylesterase
MSNKFHTPLSDIGYQTWGTKGDYPILALHGWLDNSSSFLPIGNWIELNNVKVHLVSIDFPGHGHSSWRPDRSFYSFIDYIADIHSVVESLGWTKFSILGHSMGGGLGSLYAGAFPSKVEKLGLIEALGPVTREAESAPEYLAQAIQRFLDHSHSTQLAEESAFRSIESLVRLRLRAGDMHPESAKILLQRGTEELPNGKRRLRRDPRLNLPTLIRLTEDQVYSFLHKISCPCLLLWGDEGYKWEKKLIDKRVECLKNLDQITIPGHHHLHMDHPDSVGELFMKFFLE